MILFWAALALQEQPYASGDLYQRGVTERRAGHPDVAASILEDLVRREPDNSDGWVQLGFARRDLGDREGSRSAFETALKLAPEYQDAKDGLASLDRSAPEGPGDLFRPSVSLDVSKTAVIGGEDWSDWRVATSAPVAVAMQITASLEKNHRFGLSDTYIESRIDARPSGELAYYASIGGTPDADFRPVWQVRAGGTRKLSSNADPFLISWDSGAAKYASGRVWTISPGFQKYFGSGRSWFSGQWINIFAGGRHLSGGLARFDAMVTSSVRLFGGAARAPDLAEGRAIQTTSLFGGTAVAINNRVNWRASIARDAPSSGQRRLTLSTGLELKFR